MRIQDMQPLAGRLRFSQVVAWGFIWCLSIMGWPLRAARKEAWLEVRSPHFIAYSDAGVDDARATLRGFEAMRSMFTAVLPGLRVDLHKPMIILVTRDQDSMRRFVPKEFEGKDPKRPAGLFWQGHERNYALVRMDVDLQDDQPLFVVFHEYTHCVVHQNFADLPIWLDEGLADFYGTTQIRAKEVYLGRIPLGHLRTLQDGRMPLEELLTVTHDSPHYQEGSKAGVFYAQSWALVHYLFMDEQARKSKLFGQFIQALGREPDSLSAARAAFGDLKKLEGAVATYASKPAFAYWNLPLKVSLLDKDLQARPVDEAEALAVRAEFLLHGGQLEAGAALAEKARNLVPESAAAQAAWGMACLGQGRYDEAQAALQKALALGTQDFRVPYRLALLAQEAHVKPQPEEAQVRAWLARGLALQPDFPDLHMALSRELARRPEDQEQAIQEGWAAAKLDPSNLVLRLNLGGLLMNLGRLPEAEEVGRQAARMAANSRDRAIVQSYQDQLVNFRDQLVVVSVPPASLGSAEPESPAPPPAAGAKPLKFWLPDTLLDLNKEIQKAVLEDRLEDAIRMVKAAIPKAKGRYEKPSLQSLLQALKARKAGH